jgi:hypothetical protein
MNKANRKHQRTCLETGEGGRNKNKFLTAEPEGSKVHSQLLLL